MYKQISYAERYALAVCLKDNLSYREISKKLGRSPNTWNYEVINNGGSREAYTPHLAQLSASLRKWQVNSQNPSKNKRVWDFVLRRLKKRFSPEQISKDIITQYPKDITMRISHETIYAFINSKEGKEMELHRLLRHKRLRKQRKTGMRAVNPKKPKIPNRISIHDRSDIVERKERFGDWESDLMEGKRSTGACLCIMKERLSQYMVIIKIPDKTSDSNVIAIVSSLKVFPKKLRFTITYDNGSENVEHERINHILGTESYFCDTYASWQKGSVENGIGLIRDYLPKKTDLTKISNARIKQIQDELNNRLFNFRTFCSFNLNENRLIFNVEKKDSFFLSSSEPSLTSEQERQVAELAEKCLLDFVKKIKNIDLDITQESKDLLTYKSIVGRFFPDEDLSKRTFFVDVVLRLLRYEGRDYILNTNQTFQDYV